MVKLLVQHGFTGKDKWANVILVGAKADRATKEEMDSFTSIAARERPAEEGRDGAGPEPGDVVLLEGGCRRRTGRSQEYHDHREFEVHPKPSKGRRRLREAREGNLQGHHAGPGARDASRVRSRSAIVIVPQGSPCYVAQGGVPHGSLPQRTCGFGQLWGQWDDRRPPACGAPRCRCPRRRACLWRHLWRAATASQRLTTSQPASGSRPKLGTRVKIR